uniref:Uncharacterized protein n=1 Tax=Caenorhabditis japonica TaxID=281687 RepID=A0A8R1E834_CAEJA
MDVSMMAPPVRKRGAKRGSVLNDNLSLSDLVAKVSLMKLAMTKLECTIKEYQITIDVQQNEIDRLRDDLDEAIRMRDSLPPTKPTVSSSMSLARSCSLYSDVVKRNPLFAKVSDRLALDKDLFNIDKKRTVAVVENLNDSKLDNQDAVDKCFF